MVQSPRQLLRPRTLALVGTALAVVAAALVVVPASATIASGGPGLGVVAVLVRPQAASSPPNPFTDGMPATVAVGQTGLSTFRCPAPSANSTCDAVDAIFDAAGDLWVTDRGRNRILEFVPPFETNMSASLVIGQATFLTGTAATTASGLSQPSALAFDAAGDLWVGDSGNDRVLEYVPPFHDGMDASVVIGEPAFNTNSLNATNASNLDFPEAPAFAANGDLLVSDFDDNRVLEYTPPFRNGEPASVVLGQANFTSGDIRLTAYGMERPVGIAVTPSGDLWVASAYQSRLLEYVPPFTTNESASLVLGQPNFTVATVGDGAANLNEPYGVGVDARGDVWAAEYLGSRVVEYVPPFSNGMNASVVIGQTGFGVDVAGIGPAQMVNPRSVAFSPDGNLWVADIGLSRVTEYVPTHYVVRFTESGLPSGSQWAAAVGPFAGTSTTSSLLITVTNGSWSYDVEGSGGYLASPASGSLTVNGTTSAISVSFVSSNAFGSALLWLVVAVVLAIVAVVEAVVLLRRRPKGQRPPPTPVAPAPSPPTGATAPATGGATGPGSSPPPG